ncbi:hypothetical protein BD779DRAFT_1671569 [Infundibulicybe gibba]|nr:hypothetical protein BD779DRAFT_1671569 [Infundibulicybe gibba]
MPVASHNRTHFLDSGGWAPHGTSIIVEHTPASFLRQLYVHRESSYIVARNYMDMELKYLPEIVSRAIRRADVFGDPATYPLELRKELTNQMNYDYLPPSIKSAASMTRRLLRTHPPLLRIIIRDGDCVCDGIRSLPFQDIEDNLAAMPGAKVILLFLSDDVCFRKFVEGFSWLHSNQRLARVTEEDIFGERTEEEVELSRGPESFDERGRRTLDPHAPGLENEYSYMYTPEDDPFNDSQITDALLNRTMGSCW